MAGFCANPAVFAANGMTGWALVNCDMKQLAAECYAIADAMLEVRKGSQPCFAKPATKGKPSDDLF